MGPNWVIVGDAAGSINPFNGEGIDYAYETGRLAASLVAEAVATSSPWPLQRYPEILEDTYGLYFKVARLFAQVIGRPALMRELTRGHAFAPSWSGCCGSWPTSCGTTSWGAAEAVYRSAATLARMIPEPKAA
ncbi:MAG: hypothetical protein M5U19_03440 [Microthrixaceae bacterium]|nr:hypothetical protein [Microthrixaceae bacterium]